MGFYPFVCEYITPRRILAFLSLNLLPCLERLKHRFVFFLLLDVDFNGDKIIVFIMFLTITTTTTACTVFTLFPPSLHPQSFLIRRLKSFKTMNHMVVKLLDLILTSEYVKLEGKSSSQLGHVVIVPMGVLPVLLNISNCFNLLPIVIFVIGNDYVTLM